MPLNGAITASTTGDSHPAKPVTTPFMLSQIDTNKSFINSHAPANPRSCPCGMFNREVEEVE
jgi:hypothetical protein